MLVSRDGLRAEHAWQGASHHDRDIDVALGRGCSSTGHDIDVTLGRECSSTGHDIGVTLGGGLDRSIRSKPLDTGTPSVVRYGVDMRLGLAVVLAAAWIAGCGSDDGAGGGTDDFIDVDTPPGNCSAGTGGIPCPTPGSDGSPNGGPCAATEHCAEPGSSCIAPFDDGQVGEFICTAECIALDDATAWCLDASACCTEGAICRRGLCVPDEGLDGSGTETGSTETGTTGTGSTGSAGTEQSTGGTATTTTGV